MMTSEFKFNVGSTPCDVVLGGTNIKMLFEDSSEKVELNICSDNAQLLADKILSACGLDDTEEMQDKIYELENRINELEEEKEQVNDRLEYMKQHDCYVGF